nr:hypothetical protein Iba_chr12dCG18300 [Ipomoea batatas]
MSRGSGLTDGRAEPALCGWALKIDKSVRTCDGGVALQSSEGNGFWECLPTREPLPELSLLLNVTGNHVWLRHGPLVVDQELLRMLLKATKVRKASQTTSEALSDVAVSALFQHLLLFVLLNIALRATFGAY